MGLSSDVFKTGAMIRKSDYWLPLSVFGADNTAKTKMRERTGSQPDTGFYKNLFFKNSNPKLARQKRGASNYFFKNNR